MFVKLATLFISLLVIIGCNSGQEETITICEIGGMQNIDIKMEGNRTVTLEAIGDQVVRMDETNRMDIEIFSDLLNMDKEDFIELWEDDPEFVREIFMDSTEILTDGTTTEILDITDEFLIMRVVRSIDEMRLEDLELLTGQPVSFISLDEMVEGIENYEEGVCVQQ